MQKETRLTRELLTPNGRIPYTLKKSTRAKRARIQILLGGEVVVTMPVRASVQLIERFLLDRAAWITEKRAQMIDRQKNAPAPLEKTELRRLKVVARELVHRRLEFFNEHYHHTYHKVTIRNQKTRWGSCSSKGNLNFHVRLALLPPELADYVVVHELCHLKEMNHSSRFWNLVAQTIPPYKKLRKTLKQSYTCV